MKRLRDSRRRLAILLASGTCIGAIAVSGLPQREEHELIVAVLAEYLGQPLAELALG